jgi:hypothetical protein
VITWLDTQEEAEILDVLDYAEIEAAKHAFEASIARDIPSAVIGLRHRRDHP